MIWVIGVTLLFSSLVTRPPQLDMLLSNLTVRGSGAQSVTADRDIRRSNGSNKYKGVRQQYIMKNY